MTLWQGVTLPWVARWDLNVRLPRRSVPDKQGRNMRRRFAPVAIAASTLLALGSTALTATAAPSSGTALDQSAAVDNYIVVLTADADARSISSAHDARLGVDVGHVYTCLLYTSP